MSWKRSSDLVLLALAAPVVLPVLAVLMGLAWLAHGRPLFFRQPRLGLRGKTFLVWKLRSMGCEADPRARRPTRFGHWMRERGVDELPQLFNVLRGEMSLVGPRPLTPEDSARLAAQHPGFLSRLEVRPGLTGPAQVSLARGAAVTSRLERRYAQRATLRTDLGIMLRTLWMHVVGKRRGAARLPDEVRP